MCRGGEHGPSFFLTDNHLYNLTALDRANAECMACIGEGNFAGRFVAGHNQNVIRNIRQTVRLTVTVIPDF